MPLKSNPLYNLQLLAQMLHVKWSIVLNFELHVLSCKYEHCIWQDQFFSCFGFSVVVSAQALLVAGEGQEGSHCQQLH